MAEMEEMNAVYTKEVRGERTQLPKNHMILCVKKL